MTNVNPASALELGTAMARASWDAALRSSAQASEVVSEISKLQSEMLARWMQEALRAQREMNELGQRMLAMSTQALSQSLQGMSSTIEQGADARTALEAPPTSEAGVRRREKAA
ncbi:MAG TPA: hypothetical protein VFX67_00315 [Burkholderiales bacterium]|nr:hypothetical protein [Burkholderiales bacterium]